ncbi:MAG: hypothetical protein P8X73_08570, partial [Ignavibacteriaceae bacterium]
LLSFILFFFGCADSPNSPVETKNDSYSSIRLPAKTGFSVESSFSVTKEIKGAQGGILEINESYISADGGIVNVFGLLRIPKHAFQGKQDITFTIDDQIAAAKFTPHMVFDFPVELKLEFEGISINEIQNIGRKYDFLYFDDNGKTEEVNHSDIIVAQWAGKIMVEQAFLNHFSRYAFTR